MVEVVLAEGDRLDRALKVFKRKMQRSGILKDLRRKRHYVKPSEARALKAAAARRHRLRNDPRYEGFTAAAFAAQYRAEQQPKCCSLFCPKSSLLYQGVDCSGNE